MAILKDGWKLQVSKRPNKMWLYSLRVDPTEKSNLISLLCPCRKGTSCSCSQYINNSSIEYHGPGDKTKTAQRYDNDHETVYSDLVSNCLSSTFSTDNNDLQMTNPYIIETTPNDLVSTNNVCELNISKREIFSRLCSLLKTLHSINGEQSKPVWPWVVEAPISIDNTPNIPERDDDEYIYWLN